MKVSVYRLPGGRIDIMVEASQGNSKSPVVLQGITKQNLHERVGPAVEAQKGRAERLVQGVLF